MKGVEVRQVLLRLCAECGALRKTAARLGVSPSYLSKVLNGKAEIGPKILTALGLQKVVDYQAKEDQ